MISRLFLIACFFPLNAWAWASPEIAINEFLKYELDGGRLGGHDWKTYLSKYIAAPANYDEPGFDMVTVVKSYKIGPIQCKNDQCSTVVTFELTKIQNNSNPPVFLHPHGGYETLEIYPVKISGDWRIKPIIGNPHISESTYAKFQNRLSHSSSRGR